MNVYEIITERILAEMEKGVLPWHKPWKSALGEEPANLVSHKAYRGINRFLLSHAPYERPYWLSFKQAQTLGGTVKRGEKGAPAVFWKFGQYEKPLEDGTLESHNSVLLRYYTVFNVAQCEGLDKYLPPVHPVEGSTIIPPIESAEKIVRQYKNSPAIREKAGDRAYYQPSTDTIVLPQRSQFSTDAEFYSTLFHECVHSTGHESRLKRSTLLDAHYFGDENYSREELVAELGAAFLCGEAGIENEAALKNSVAYLHGWKKKLREDSKIIVIAAAQAQKAADHILGKTLAE